MVATAGRESSLTSIDRIRDLCDALVATARVELPNVVQPGGFGLADNGFVVEAMTLRELQAATVGLAKVSLIPPNAISFINRDHFDLWAWCAQLLVSVSEGLARGDRSHQRERLDYLAMALLTGHSWSPSSGLRYDGLGASAQRFLSHVAFPALESAARHGCSPVLEPSGRVTSSFSVTNGDGSKRTYTVNSRCSRLGHVLELLAGQASVPLAEDLRQLLDHVAGFGDSGGSGQLVLDEWRNELLHGETTDFNRGFFVAMIVLLVELHHFESEWGHRFDEWQHTARTLRGSPWSFLPEADVP